MRLGETRHSASTAPTAIFTVHTRCRERRRGSSIPPASSSSPPATTILPNRLGVPGEDLPHVSHYYTEPHPFWREDVVVIGGKNSAAEAALDLYRNGAHVTMVHRQARNSVPPSNIGSVPDIENRIKADQVRAPLRDPRRCASSPDVVHVARPGRAREAVPAAQVFALTGYHPDFTFLRQPGRELDPQTNKPALDPQTLESNVPGIYLAGVVIGGNHTSEIFIENGRFHGKQIVAALTGTPLLAAQP